MDVPGPKRNACPGTLNPLSAFAVALVFLYPCDIPVVGGGGNVGDASLSASSKRSGISTARFSDLLPLLGGKGSILFLTSGGHHPTGRVLHLPYLVMK